MARDYSKIPIDQMRRKDRQTDETFITEMLGQVPFCTIGHSLEDQPFLHTNTFIFNPERKAIYFHTAAEGRMRFNAEKNRRVCFSISKMGRLLPAKVALEFSVEYESVVVFGDVQVVEDPREAKDMLQALLDKYFPHLESGKDYRSTTDEELKRTAVYRIDITSWSGKKKLEPPEFPGAFLYGEP